MLKLSGNKQLFKAHILQPSGAAYCNYRNKHQFHILTANYSAKETISLQELGKIF